VGTRAYLLIILNKLITNAEEHGVWAESAEGWAACATYREHMAAQPQPPGPASAS
jgi:hypothetical protein